MTTLSRISVSLSRCARPMQQPTRRKWPSTTPVSGNRNGRTKTKRHKGKKHRLSRYCVELTWMWLETGPCRWNHNAISICRFVCLSNNDGDWIGPAFVQRDWLFTNALDSLAPVIIRRCCAKLALPMQTLIPPLVVHGKKSGAPHNRHFAHNSSSHDTTGLIMVSETSSLLDSGTLRSKVIPPFGRTSRELRVQFPWDMRTIYNSIKAHIHWDAHTHISDCVSVSECGTLDTGLLACKSALLLLSLCFAAT